jgi:hypothetical protein
MNPHVSISADTVALRMAQLSPLCSRFGLRRRGPRISIPQWLLSCSPNRMQSGSQCNSIPDRRPIGKFSESDSRVVPTRPCGNVASSAPESSHHDGQ